MKLLGFLVFLMLALSAFVRANEDVDPEVEACKVKCLDLPHDPVCGTGKATYWNECEMKCENAEFIHKGACTYDELMDNRVHH